MMGGKIWIAAAALLSACGAAAAAAPAGRENFLSHGPGAAEAAMGEAVAATVAGPAGLYYNAAGLSLGDSGVSGEWTRLMPGVSYSWLGAVADIHVARLGLGLVNLDLGQVTGHSTYDDPGTTISSYQRAYMIGTSREVLPGLTAGSAVGLLDYNLAGMRSGAYFADLGLAYSTPRLWRFGLAVKNAYFSGLDFGGSKEVYPRDIRLGAAMRKDGLVLSAQVDKVMDGSSPVFSLGAGYSFLNVMFLRAGFNGYPAFGLGFVTKNRLFSVDCSYQAQALAGSERITLGYYFAEQDDDGPKDAYDALQERAGSLAAFLSEEAKQSLEQHKDSDAKEQFEKLLAIEPGNRDAAAALGALTHRAYPRASQGPGFLRFFRKSRDKAYLRFAVKFAEGDMPEACPAAGSFLQRWPRDSRGPLMRVLFADKSCEMGGATTSKEDTKHERQADGPGGPHEGAGLEIR